MRSLTARLRTDRRGAALVEFAIVLPVMIVAILGLMELCYEIYVQSVLTGAVQKAGRDSGLESSISNPTTVDQQVLSTVHTIAGLATFAPNFPTRQNFSSFRQIGRTGPEPFVDTNNNGVRDPGECFDDVNGNGMWDSQATPDDGSAGTGGASDVVVYTVQINYPRILPLGAFLGWSDTASVKAITVLRNQPFSSQTKSEQTICT